MSEQHTTLVNLARLRGLIIEALCYTEDGCIDAATPEAISRSLCAALEVLNRVEDRVALPPVPLSANFVERRAGA